MTQAFVGQLVHVGFAFAPKGYALCNGQLLPISQNTALFSLLGTFYGGDGKSNFALPDMRGRAPVKFGQGPGLTLYDIGEATGAEGATLDPTQIPAHAHTLVVSTDKGTTAAPAAGSMLGRAVALTQLPLVYIPSTPAPTLVNTAAKSIRVTGGLPPVIQPALTVSCCIALQGIFPARN
jgi:microcystin-dependent protein